jgi:surface antigen
MTAPVKARPNVRHPGTAEAMIAVASSQIGYREGSDNDTAYGEWYQMNHVAWCAIFQTWSTYWAGCTKVIPKFAYTPAGAGWFQAQGRWGHRPKVGALAFFYSSSMGRIHHVALVVRVLSDGSFLTVEGNTNDDGSAQGNGVYKLHRSGVGGDQGGFGYPQYARIPTQPTSPPAWRLGDGFPGEKAFLLGKAHPAVPVLRARLRLLGFGTSASRDPTFTRADRRNVRHYQESRSNLRGDRDGYPGRLTWNDLYADARRARKRARAAHS